MIGWSRYPWDTPRIFPCNPSVSAGFPAMELMTLRSTQDEQLDLGMNGASSSHYHEGDSLWVQKLLQMRDDSPL